jgi:hypothetical protein
MQMECFYNVSLYISGRAITSNNSRWYRNPTLLETEDGVWKVRTNQDMNWQRVPKGEY